MSCKDKCKLLLTIIEGFKGWFLGSPSIQDIAMALYLDNVTVEQVSCGLWSFFVIPSGLPW